MGIVVITCLLPSIACAQNAPPSYEADASVYKVVFEDQNFRIIAGTWKPGQTDKSHSHLSAAVAYNLTDCSLKLVSADGKVVNLNNKAGTANTVGITPSHTATNVGPAECRVLLVERK
jgi:hypothetical protein